MLKSLKRIIRTSPPLDQPVTVDWDVDQLIATSIREIGEEVVSQAEPLAEESAVTFLRKSLRQLDNDDTALTDKIAELSERLRSVKLTKKSFQSALDTIETDEKRRDARMPQAVQFSGVTG